ncbi:hypothetical protein B0C58_004703 [Salmonella enterica subsp. enterica serovar Oranienburg]|nr:hypothetical protein [Salmonella enterica subsp. enterica serovar Oranienburg]
MKPLIKPEPGDLFYIPALNISDVDGFVLARYIEFIKPNLGYLIEVFEHFYTELPEKRSVDTSSRLFRPIFCSMRFSDIPKWKILFSDPDYDKSKSGYERISFAFDGSIWIGGVSKKATPEQLINIEPSVCWRMDHIVFRTIAHLKRLVHKNDVMNYHQLPIEYRVDNEIAKRRVRDISEIMDKKFNAWGRG